MLYSLTYYTGDAVDLYESHNALVFVEGDEMTCGGNPHGQEVNERVEFTLLVIENLLELEAVWNAINAVGMYCVRSYHA